MLSSVKPKILLSGPGIFLALVWLYMAGWGTYIAARVFGRDAGRLEFEDWVLIGADLIPILLIPIYLGRCVCRGRAPLLRPWFPWVVRLMYVSIIFAMCDCWAFAERGAPILTRITWKTRGYSFGGIRFGYCLTCSGDEHEYGPVVWFWFSPVTITMTNGHCGIRWFFGES